MERDHQEDARNKAWNSGVYPLPPPLDSHGHDESTMGGNNVRPTGGDDSLPLNLANEATVNARPLSGEDSVDNEANLGHRCAAEQAAMQAYLHAAQLAHTSPGASAFVCRPDYVSPSALVPALDCCALYQSAEFHSAAYQMALYSQVAAYQSAIQYVQHHQRLWGGGGGEMDGIVPITRQEIVSRWGLPPPPTDATDWRVKEAQQHYNTIPLETGGSSGHEVLSWEGHTTTDVTSAEVPPVGAVLGMEDADNVRLHEPQGNHWVGGGGGDGDQEHIADFHHVFRFNVDVFLAAKLVLGLYLVSNGMSTAIFGGLIVVTLVYYLQETNNVATLVIQFLSKKFWGERRLRVGGNDLDQDGAVQRPFIPHPEGPNYRGEDINRPVRPLPHIGMSLHPPANETAGIIGELQALFLGFICSLFPSWEAPQQAHRFQVRRRRGQAQARFRHED